MIKTFQLVSNHIQTTLILQLLLTLGSNNGILSYQPSDELLKDLVEANVLSAEEMKKTDCWILNVDSDQHDGEITTYSSEIQSLLIWKLLEHQTALSEAVAERAGTKHKGKTIPMSVQILANPPNSSGQEVHADVGRENIAWNMTINVFHRKKVDKDFAATKFIVPTTDDPSAALQPPLIYAHGYIYDQSLLHHAVENATDECRYLLHISWYRCEETQTATQKTNGSRTWKLPYFDGSNSKIPKMHREQYAKYSCNTIKPRRTPALSADALSDR